MNKTVITPTIAKFVKQAIRQDLLNLNTSMPGKIKTYDKDTQKASITPLIKKRFKDKNNTIVEIPTLNNVPVRMSSCNNRKTFVYFPVKLGDLGIVHFCTRSIDNYLATPDV